MFFKKREPAGVMPAELPPSQDVAIRHERVRGLIEAEFYLRRQGLAPGADALQHYLEHGRTERLDPSALFDTRYYLAQLGPEGLPSSLTAAEHYLDHGVGLGLDPSPLFRTSYYLRSNPDVMAAGVNPLVHFMQSGAREGRRPVPAEEMELDTWLAGLRTRDPGSGYADTFTSLVQQETRAAGIASIFDGEYYRDRYGIGSQVDAVRHYIEEGGPAGLDPSPFFDTAFYLAQLGPDSLASGRTPLEHYLSVGADAGHAPSPLFDTRFYVAQNADVAMARVNPLLHFVQSGAREGRLPVSPERVSVRSWADALLARDPANAYARHLVSTLLLQERAVRIAPIVDTHYYRKRHGLGGDVVRHYLQEGGKAGLDPSPVFDSAFYLAQLGPEVLEDGTTPLEHYLWVGADAGHDPSPLFVTRFYLADNPDVVAAGTNPLLHFVQSGASEGRVGLPLFLPNIEERILRAMRSAGPDYPVRRLVANLRLKQGRLDEALALIEGGSGADGVTDHVLEGRVLHALGRLPEAISAYEKSAADGNAPDQVDKLVAERLVHEAYVLETAEKLQLAIESYEAAIARRHPEERRLRDHLSTLKRVHVEALYSRGEREAAASLARATLWAEDGAILERDLVSVQERCQMVGDPYHEILPARGMAAPDLLFLGKRPNLTAERGSLKTNAVYFATVSGCTAFSQCNVLLAGDVAVYDLPRRPGTEGAVLNDRVFGKPLIRARSRDRLMLEMPALPSVSVESGLAMFGVQSGNYGHWFLEYLPKMLVFDKEARTDVPVYIDPGMPATHLESLDVLNAKNRPIRYMPEGSAVRFGELGVAPVPAYFPLDLKRNAYYDTVWPADVFSELRSALIAGLERKGGRASRSKRPILISRKAFASRQLVNETEISELLAPLGFETIYPEQLTFAEQVDVFRNASIVVGSCSSALTNCIFCDPDCPVIGLIHDEPSFNFNGYASFLLAGGVRIMFVQGETIRQVGTHPLHSRFRIQPERVTEAIRISGWAPSS